MSCGAFPLVRAPASWTWALGTIFTKKEAKEFNPYFSLGLQMVIGGGVLCAVSYATGNTVGIQSIPWQSWVAIAYLVIFGSVITFFAFLYSLQRLPTAQMSIYAYINPIVAVILGTTFFGEKLTTFIIAGGAITLYGVYMINTALRKSAAGKALE